MGLLDKVKEQAEQTAAKAREGVGDVQTKRELSQAYTDLGKTAFALVERVRSPRRAPTDGRSHYGVERRAAGRVRSNPERELTDE